MGVCLNTQPFREDGQCLPKHFLPPTLFEVEKEREDLTDASQGREALSQSVSC